MGKHDTDALMISPLDPYLAQSQILWPVEYLVNTSVYWSRLSIKSRSLKEHRVKFVLSDRAVHSGMAFFHPVVYNL